jgi:hypothetical protein
MLHSCWASRSTHCYRFYAVYNSSVEASSSQDATASLIRRQAKTRTENDCNRERERERLDAHDKPTTCHILSATTPLMRKAVLSPLPKRSKVATMRERLTQHRPRRRKSRCSRPNPRHAVLLLHGSADTLLPLGAPYNSPSNEPPQRDMTTRGR